MDRVDIAGGRPVVAELGEFAETVLGLEITAAVENVAQRARLIDRRRAERQTPLGEPIAFLDVGPLVRPARAIEALGELEQELRVLRLERKRGAEILVGLAAVGRHEAVGELRLHPRLVGIACELGFQEGDRLVDAAGAAQDRDLGLGQSLPVLGGAHAGVEHLHRLVVLCGQGEQACGVEPGIGVLGVERAGNLVLPQRLLMLAHVPVGIAEQPLVLGVAGLAPHDQRIGLDRLGAVALGKVYVALVDQRREVLAVGLLRGIEIADRVRVLAEVLQHDAEQVVEGEILGLAHHRLAQQGLGVVEAAQVVEHDAELEPGRPRDRLLGPLVELDRLGEVRRRFGFRAACLRLLGGRQTVLHAGLTRRGRARFCRLGMESGQVEITPWPGPWHAATTAALGYSMSRSIGRGTCSRRSWIAGNAPIGAKNRCAAKNMPRVT